MTPAASSEVDAVLATLDHPLEPIVTEVRAAIRSVSPRIVETIKWAAPNFAVHDDFATLNLRRPTAVQVILHTGAKPKPEHPEITVADPAGLLRWADRNRAVITFTDHEQALEALPAFTAIVHSWVSQLEG